MIKQSYSNGADILYANKGEERQTDVNIRACVIRADLECCI